jgi:hypothetical protein
MSENDELDEPQMMLAATAIARIEKPAWRMRAAG